MRQSLAVLTDALKRDPIHRRIKETVKRLREDENYDDDESTQYAIKTRKFLIEWKLDEHSPPSYEEDKEQAQTPSLNYKALMNTLQHKPMKCKTMSRKTVS